MKAIILARVSDPKQQEGYSIDAQLTRVTSYCDQKEFQIKKSFSFQETASHKIRKNFEEIITFIEESKDPVAIVADTVDRITRNFRDAIRIDDLRLKGKVEIHCLRENLIIHQNSNSAEIMRWDMSVMFAKNYILNVGDNVKRSQEQSILSGKWPSRLPLGYIRTDDEYKDTIIDPNKAPYIKKIFEWYSSGTISMESIRVKLKKLGFTTNSGKHMSKSKIDQTLGNPFYYGYMRWKNQTHEGRHEPIITKEIFEKAQDVKEGYHKRPFKHATKELAFRGLITCAKCGCTITGEIQKKKYTYWHCTNYHGNCERLYVPEKTIDDQITKLLAKLQIPPKRLTSLVESLKQTHNDKIGFVKQTIDNLQKEYNAVEKQIDIMYNDRLSGRITTDQYDNILTKKKKRQQEILEETERHRRADKNYYITAEKVLYLASEAVNLYKSSKPDEKRALTNFLLSNCQLDGKILRYTLKKPYDTILKYAYRKEWLPLLNAFRTDKSLLLTVSQKEINTILTFTAWQNRSFNHSASSSNASLFFQQH